MAAFKTGLKTALIPEVELLAAGTNVLSHV